MISGSFVCFVFLAFGAVWLFPFPFLSFSFSFSLGALLFPLSFATPPFHKLCSKSFFSFLFFLFCFVFFCFFFAFKECNDPLIDSSNQSTSKHKQQRKEEQTTNKQQQRALKQTLNRQKTEKGATQRRAVQEVRWQEERERERRSTPHACEGTTCCFAWKEMQCAKHNDAVSAPHSKTDSR